LPIIKTCQRPKIFATDVRGSTSFTLVSLLLTTIAVAGSNAAKARDDADAAEATAQTLAENLQSIQTVCDETKQASKLLIEEHEEVKKMSESLQKDLLTKMDQLANAQVELRALRSSHDKLRREGDDWKQERADLQDQIAHKERQVGELQRNLSDARALENSEKKRNERLKADWASAREGMLKATEGQKQAQETQAKLEQSLSRVQQINRDLNDQLDKEQDRARKDRDRLNADLSLTSRQLQDLRIKAEAAAELTERLEADKAAAEKQAAHYKRRVASLENRLEQVTLSSLAVGSPPPPASTVSARGDGGGSLTHQAAGADSSDGTNGSGNGKNKPFSLPPLQQPGTSSGASVGSGTGGDAGAPPPQQSDRCCICLKASYGMMQKCQCGSRDCGRRAHSLCANRIQPGTSVSHPCTPAPRLPLILCQPAIPSLPNNAKATGGSKNRAGSGSGR
jgi:hypothetical protein